MGLDVTKTLDELRALTVRLEALADPEQEATPGYENTDWRGLANTCAHALRELIADAERTRELEQELRNIAEAKRFDKEHFSDDRVFADWAQSRARWRIARPTHQG